MSGRPAQSQAGTPVWTSSPGSLESRGPLETGEEILDPGEGGLCCLCWTCQNTNNSQFATIYAGLGRLITGTNLVQNLPAELFM